MKKATMGMISVLLLICLLAAVMVIPGEVSAASEFYGNYTDISKIYDSGSCPSMQGLAVGSQKLYTVKINSTNTKAFISMTDKDTGSTSMLYNSDAGSYYFDYLGHANDMDVWSIDSYSNLFVTTTNADSNAIVRLKRSGNNLTKVASYSLTYNGSATSCSALSIKSVSNGVITFITKLGMNLYTGSVSTSATSANIELTKLCTISKSKVYIKGSYLDLSDFVNQGMGYYKGMLYVPITGDSTQLNRSVVMVFNLNDVITGSTLYPSEAVVFRVTSSTYSALMEIESCDISSGDGKLYFNANRRKTTSDTDHDAVSCFDDYTFVQLTEPAAYRNFIVQYDANGGSGTMDNTIVPYGVSTKLSANTYTRKGYNFAGWTAYRSSQAQWYYTDGTTNGWYAEGSQPTGYDKYIYRDQQSVAKTSSVDGDTVMMYAQWTPITYTVRYDANGGSGTMDDTTVTFGVSTALRANAFERTGYTFAGWTAYRTAQDQWRYGNGTDTGWYTKGTQPEGYTEVIYKDGSLISKTTAVDGDVTVFTAQWTPNTYTVTFKDEDGTVLQSSQVTFGTMPTPPADPTKSSDGTYTYTFAGWDTEVVACAGDAVYTATYEAALIPVPVFTPSYPALVFEDEIYYNIYFTTSDMDGVALEDMGMITWNTPQENGTIETAMDIIPGAFQSSDGDFCVHSSGIPAKNLADTLYFKIYAKMADGSYVYSDVYGYNAKLYAEDRIANSTDPKMKALCVAMLNYGASAQIYFDYKPYQLMNADLTAEQQALVSAYSSDMVSGLSPVDSSKVGAFAATGGYSGVNPTVSFEGAFSINYYVTPSYAVDGEMTMYYWKQSDYEAAEVLSADNATGSMVLSATDADAYLGTVDAIAAKQIDSPVYVVCVYQSGGVSYVTGVLPYSLGAYCVDRINYGTDTMRDLASATAVYGYYAKDYFA